MIKVGFFNIVSFLAAFLLFQIELIMAKIFLPNYGGGFYVWGACVVFFQAMLLGGYVFSYFAIKTWGINNYRRFYALLFILPLLSWHDVSCVAVNPNIPVVLDIFWQLGVKIGLAFIILSTVSVTLQAWFAHSGLNGGKGVFSLYASSNLGSLLGLVTYPIFFEMQFGLHEQLKIWQFLYLALLVLVGVLWCTCKTKEDHNRVEESLGNPQGTSVVDRKVVLRWCLLGMIGTVLFLSVTNIITHDIAPIPLFWIIPLCIYLVTFILSFKENPFAPAWLPKIIPGLIGYAIFFYLIPNLSGLFGFVIYNVVLFLLCLFVQNELYRLRPQRREDLAAFYVMISVGSLLGGVLVSWVIPLVTVTFSEFIVGLMLLSVVLLLDPKLESQRDYFLRLIALSWLLIFQDNQIYTCVVNVLVIAWIWFLLKKKPNLFYTVCFLILFLATSMPQVLRLVTGKQYVFKDRNYYGITKVLETSTGRFLVHGTTIHGGEEISTGRPVTYYHHTTPVSEILQDKDGFFQFRSIGVIGLGAGAVAAYSKAGQVIDFYELDPDMFPVADRYFSFLRASKAQANHIFGDARLSLNQNRNQYDLLLVDAFGSDAVPVHLLTLEAFRLYRGHIADNGLILYNFSNRFVNLLPVIKKSAVSENAFCFVKRNGQDSRQMISSSLWSAVTWDPVRAEYLRTHGWEELDDRSVEHIRPWTDSYTNVFPFIQWQNPFKAPEGG